MGGKLSAVVLGCGDIAGGYDMRNPGDSVMTHAKAYSLNPGVELEAAYDPDPERLAEFCSYWNVPKQAQSVEALFSDRCPDIVSICSPNETHFPLIKEILRHPVKAIWCEKPLALSLAEAAEIDELCQKRGIILAVNYLRRWDSTLDDLGKRITAGEFGEAKSARVHYTKGIFHNASHAINLLQAWFGAPKSPVVWRSRAWLGGDISASFAIFFERCPDVAFQASDSGNFSIFDIEIILERARIVLEGGGSSVSIYLTQPSALQKNISVLARPETAKGTLHNAMANVLTDILSAVAHGTGLKMPAYEAVATIAACEEIREVARKIGE